MTRFLRIIAIVCSLLLTLSLLGCGTNQESTKKSEKEVKPAAIETSNQTNTPVADEKDTVQIKSEEKTEAVTKNVAPAKQTVSTTQQTSAATNNSSKVSSNTTSNKPASTTTAAAPATKPTVTTSKPQEPQAAVTVSIEGPKDRGTILATASVSFKDGDTMFNCLLQAAKKHNIVVDSTGSGSTAYIQGIDNIYEFDYGAKSGWVFKLNGASITKSVGAINVKDGDRIECYYTE